MQKASIQRACGRCEQVMGVAFRFPRFGEEPRVAALQANEWRFLKNLNLGGNAESLRPMYMGEDSFFY